jgi:hypothetical protein
MSPPRWSSIATTRVSSISGTLGVAATILVYRLPSRGCVRKRLLGLVHLIQQ